MKKKLTVEEVKYVAKLANLQLSESEITKFVKQLDEVIDYNVRLLSEVNTDKVEPLYQVNSEENRVREDQSSPSLTQEEVLKNASSEHNGFFRVKRVLES